MLDEKGSLTLYSSAGSPWPTAVSIIKLLQSVRIYRYSSGMANILITYSTTDGHTRSICERLQQVVAAEQHSVVLSAMADEPDIDLAPFDKVIIGASIRYGKHQQQVFDFISRNQATLETKPNAFFSVNVVARKPEKNQPETNPYLQKFLRKIAWKPQNLAVFAGRIDYPIYTFFDRQMIRFIMWMTKGPTDPTTTIEFTDWNKVEEFGRVIADM
jgi:menaquinone-dependent protoporphyrinogen oxidase